MKFFQKIITNRLNKIIQAESNRNRALLICAKTLGYPLINIRRALFVLNDVKIQDLGCEEVSVPTLYNVKNGSRGSGEVSMKGKEILAGHLGLEADELFKEAANQ
ncbi:MAG: hypothetical protein JW882_13455 [Deltaproteobacteria bacterium]|nr:hypothetical protein [Deltaproteobacteria bacterium]